MMEPNVSIGMVTEGIKALGGLGLLIWILLKQTRLETQMKNLLAMGGMVTSHDRTLVVMEHELGRAVNDIHAAHEKHRELAAKVNNYKNEVA